jgi:hypothetical protein
MASKDPIEPGPRAPHRGDRVWQEEQKDLSDRNAEVQRQGKKQKDAHDRHVADMRRATADEVPDGRWR